MNPIVVTVFFFLIFLMNEFIKRLEKNNLIFSTRYRNKSVDPTPRALYFNDLRVFLTVQGWQPPFACDVDKLHFVPRIQRLNELEVSFVSPVKPLNI